jgi:hypothetical protein
MNDPIDEDDLKKIFPKAVITQVDNDVEGYEKLQYYSVKYNSEIETEFIYVFNVKYKKWTLCRMYLNFPDNFKFEPLMTTSALTVIISE